MRRLGEFGHLRFGANAIVDYANDPLVLRRNPSTRQELQSIVDHQLTLKFDLSLALWNRLILLAGFDAPLLMKGPDVRPGLNVSEADGPGFGDVSLGLRLRLLGDVDDVFGLGVQAVVVLPTSGGGRAYTGEDGVAVRPELIADIRTRVLRITANAGVLARQKVELLDKTIGSELTYGLGVGVPLHARFELLGELGGAFDFENFGKKTSTGIEWLLGAKANTESGWWFGAGAGSGFIRGIGTPDVRAVGQIGYLTPIRKKEEPAKAEQNDSDGDGIFDSVDACPDKPEDRDGYADEDGCPDPDNDGDGVLDAADACPSEAEDRDGFADEDGCPDPDNDADTVLDVDDACPTEPGPVENKGCPTKASIESDVFALQKVNFENDKAVIMPESFPALELVRSTLEEHSEVKKLRVEGHTDGMGAAPYNMKLSRARTSAVAGWLREHGVPRERLEAHACGELHLIADDATPEGRATNRRVEFLIIDPAPEGSDVRRKPGCVNVPVR